MGDFTLGDTIDLKFTTRRFTTGAPFTLAGTPAISAYPDNSTTQITAGITLTVDFDTVTGLNNVRVVATSGNGYATGTSYALVITTGTVDSVSVVGEVVGSFTLGRSAAFTRLGAPAGASVSADVAAVQSDTNDIQTRLPAVLVSGRMDSSVGAVAANAITAAGIADGAIDRATFAADTGLQTIRSGTAQAGAAGTVTLDASASATDDFYNDTRILLTGGTGVGQVRHIRDYVGATKVATVVPNWATNPDATSTFAVLPATSVWDETLADHLDSGSTGASLNAAGAAGDPWTTALPGAYGAGTAGNIVGNNINATVSSRATQTSVDTVDDFLDTEITDIRNRLPAALVGGRMDSSVGAMAANTITAAATAADFSTEVNAGVLAVLGALNDAAADGDPTTTDTIVQYLKQLVNVLVGTTGVVTFPASAAPANNVSLAEVIRQVYDEVAGLNGGALLDAAGVRAAVGLAAANLDTQLTAIDDAVDTEMGAIKTVTDRLDTAMELDGAVYRFTTNALEQAPSGGAAPSAATIADAVWDEAIAGHLAAGSTGAKLNSLSGAAGSGAITHTVTVTENGVPIDGALVWATTDAAGTNVVASGFTDALGEVDFFLDAGTYYGWAQRAGTNFINGASFVVA